MSQTELHSIVVPMYDEEPVAEEFLRRATAAFAALPDYEIIVVDDGSRDATFEIVSALAQADPHIKVVRFARNFGHQTATTAGIDLAAGDTVSVIDADLQDPPELIPQMVQLWRNGADVVFAVRESRAGESALKKATASAYYRLLRRIARVDIPVDTADFRLMSRKATEGLKAMRERSRYMRGLVGWMGLERATITYHRDPRFAGDTKYPLRKMMRLAADGIVSFSTLPLHAATLLGVCAAALAFVCALYAIIMKLTGGYVVPGWASIMVSVLFVGGVQLITLGVVGEYIGRVYDEVRQRPLYLIRDVRGFDAPTAEHFAESPLPKVDRRL
ncbi:MAG TPA: glycosyltransferase family 2 protein [Coriobacteriia bacterium]